MARPSVEEVNEQRGAKFLDRIDTALESSDLPLFRELVERYESEHNVPMEEIAAALAQLVQGKTPLLLKAPPERPRWEGREERGREGRTASPRHAHASGQPGRSEEHTSELQSLMRISYAVFCLKKKINTDICQ